MDLARAIGGSGGRARPLQVEVWLHHGIHNSFMFFRSDDLETKLCARIQNVSYEGGLELVMSECRHICRLHGIVRLK